METPGSHWGAAWFGASNLTLLCLSALICKMECGIVTTIGCHLGDMLSRGLASTCLGPL